MDQQILVAQAVALSFASTPAFSVGMPACSNPTRSYTFNFLEYRIVIPRSGSPLGGKTKDTNYVSASLAVGDEKPLATVRYMGDQGAGLYNLNLTFDHVELRANQKAVFSYVIVNSGHTDQNQLLRALESTGKTLAAAGAEAAATAVGEVTTLVLGAEIGGAVVPVVGAALGALGSFLVSSLSNFLTPNCDGPVAAGMHVLDARQLYTSLRKVKSLITMDSNDGLDSNSGCGANSRYQAFWRVDQE